MPYRVLHKLRHLTHVADKFAAPSWGLSSSQPSGTRLIISFPAPPRSVVAAPTSAPFVPLDTSPSTVVSSATPRPGRGVIRRHFCSRHRWRT